MERAIYFTLSTKRHSRRMQGMLPAGTSLEHDGFGELLESTNALGRVVTFDVDELGRVKTRTDKLGAQVQTTTWQWDTEPNGIGRLHSVTSPDAIQSFSYMPHGQLEGMAQTVVGGSFATRQTYDNVGRVKSVDYRNRLGACVIEVSEKTEKIVR